jgi:hypothetical protein
MKLRELFLELGVAVDTKELASFDKKLQDVKKSMKEVATAAGVMAGAFVGAVAGLAALANKESEFAEEVERTAKAFGITIAAYQELRFAYLSLNASSDDLADSFASINNTVYKARDGSKEYVRALGLLNLTWEDLINLPVDEKLIAVRNAVRALGDTDQAMAALRPILGGDLARRLAPGFADTSGAMEKFSDVARRSGLVLEDELIKQGAEARMEFRALGAVFQGITRRLGVSIAPAFARLAMILQDLAVAAMPKINKAIKRFSTFLEEEMEKAGRILDTIDQKVYQIFGGWESLFKSLSAAILLFSSFTLGSALFGAIVSIKALLATVTKAILVASAVIFAKALLIALVFGLVALALEDLYVYLQGGESWFGNIAKKMAQISPRFRLLTGIIELLSDAIGGLIVFFGELWGALKLTLSGISRTAVWHTFIGILYAVAIALAAIVIAAGVLILFLTVGFFGLIWLVFELVDMILYGWVQIWELLKVIGTGISNLWLDLKRGASEFFNYTIDKLLTVLDLLAKMNSGPLWYRGAKFIAGQLSEDQNEEGGGQNFFTRGLRGMFNPGSGVRGGGGATVTTGDINVEVNVPEGTPVDQAVGQSIAETAQSVWAENLTSMSQGI